ncbi:MAG: hypothetical protein JJT76_10805 [Clostridiaceae bacterium]|nr:hypothetical protein [Clostridiaceae bacterium]
MECIKKEILKVMDENSKEKTQSMTMEEIRKLADLKDTPMMEYMMDLKRMGFVMTEDEAIDSFTITIYISSCRSNNYRVYWT